MLQQIQFKNSYSIILRKMFDNCLTSSVKLNRPQELTGCYMKEQTINTREFLRNYKKFSAANRVIIIANHGKPEGVFVPYEQWEKQQEHKSRIFTWEDLEKYSFDGGDPNMSRDIDKILYGSKDKINKKKK